MSRRGQPARQQQQQQQQSKKKSRHTYWILICLVSSAASFYAGMFVATQHILQPQSLLPSSPTSPIRKISPQGDCWKLDDPRVVQFVRDEVQSKLQKIKQQQEQQQEPPYSQSVDQAMQAADGRLLPQESMGLVVTGMGRVSRDAFAQQFDMGVPLDESASGNHEVLLLYNRPNALPSSIAAKQRQQQAGERVPFVDSVDDATEHCDNLHVVLTDTNRPRQCIAIMGQYESFHVQKWMRLPPEGKRGALDSSFPLRLVNRGAQSNGRKSSKPPTLSQTKQHWDVLATYLSSLSAVLERLKPIVEHVATANHVVIVMVCNFGQSELLMNFVCNAKAKGLDIGNVLVFCTDLETQALAESLGLTTFHDEGTFASMPKNAAGSYGDMTFMKMMSAKVYCVQMVSMLGYDVLFQDVDVIWYRNPLPWFHNTSSPMYDFDIYFQDDGNHALFYAPYSANTGFYYVRHNDRTQYFFNSLLMAGDLILSTRSHQIALIALLNEHASMYGMKVKILERNTPEFPGGFVFHRKPKFMKELLSSQQPSQQGFYNATATATVNPTQPYIFHMSWTVNKANKILYYRQMGEWYLQQQCVNKQLDQLEQNNGGGGTGTSGYCCAAEPILSCHYRDKPSKLPCRDSPPIDKGKPSFW